MDSLQPVLIVVLLGGSVAMLATLAAARLAERRERAQVLRRLASAGALALPSRTAPADILRRSTVQAGRWWRLLQRAPFLQDSDQLLEQAGLDWSTPKLARLILLSGAGTAALALLLGQSPARVLLGFGIGMLLPTLYARRRRRKRIAAMEEQLPDSIDLLSRAIRAGHALTTALRMVADESPDPLASEFRRVFDEQKYGLRFEESLLRLTTRVDLVDVRVMVVAILVQREVGGNLAEILDNIAQLIRTRFTLRRQLRVYTAQGRMSGWVLGGLPVVLGSLIYFANPDYIGLLFTEPAGRAMVAVAIALQLTGYFWISRILKVDL